MKCCTQCTCWRFVWQIAVQHLQGGRRAPVVYGGCHATSSSNSSSSRTEGGGHPSSRKAHVASSSSRPSTPTVVVCCGVHVDSRTMFCTCLENCFGFQSMVQQNPVQYSLQDLGGLWMWSSCPISPCQSGPCPSEQPAATSAGDKSLMVYDRAITVLKAWHSLALWPWPIGWPSLEETRSYWAVIGQQQNVAVFASSRTLLALFAAWHFRCHGRLPL